MLKKKNFKGIETLEGVEQYIIIDSNGSIVIRRMDDPEKTADIVFLCGKNFTAIGKSNFKFCVFSRKNKNDFFIFPVGNYYLGVIKQKHIETFILTDIINNFLADIIKTGLH